MGIKKRKSIRLRCNKLRAAKLLHRNKLLSSTILDDNSNNITPLNQSPETFEGINQSLVSWLFKENESPEFLLSLKCPHYSISSALMYSFLYGKFSLLDSHQTYFTGKNRIYGRMAEDFVKNIDKRIKKGMCLFSKEYPWICASPDGLIGMIRRRR